ncbi:hypothetical protein PWT90_04456 [Aphanocladium album]|nr:hypothetical protein PWT90_04456 [Aphanocladium album]
MASKNRTVNTLSVNLETLQILESNTNGLLFCPPRGFRRELDTPRYLFRVCSSSSAGCTTPEAARSASAAASYPASRTCLFHMDRKVAADMVLKHLDWKSPVAADNLVSWTSSLLTALVYIFYRRAFYPESFQDIFLYVIDTSVFHRNMFLSDLDLIRSFQKYDAGLAHLAGLRRQRHTCFDGTFYFGEYLSQGSLNILGRCACVGAQSMVDGGLLDLHPRFDEFAQWTKGQERWASLVVELRQPFYQRPATGASDASRSLYPNDAEIVSGIAGLFGAGWRAPMAMALLALAPNRTGAIEVLWNFRERGEIWDPIREDFFDSATAVNPNNTLPEVAEFQYHLNDTYLEICELQVEFGANLPPHEVSIAPRRDLAIPTTDFWVASVIALAHSEPLGGCSLAAGKPNHTRRPDKLPEGKVPRSLTRDLILPSKSFILPFDSAIASIMSEPSPEEYTIGWVCALQEEYQAACRMRDCKFNGPETNAINDNNTYAFGRVGGHNVVIGCLPDGRYGNNSAASVAKDMVRSFSSLRVALMVGIGGGAPTSKKDIRLGDVVVSVPEGALGGVIQYDLGKQISGGRFKRTGQLDAPPLLLLGAIPEMRRRQDDPTEPDGICENIKRMEDMPSFRRPSEDHLYRTDYEHEGGESCAGCKADGLQTRSFRESSREVVVHYGTIASGNSVMKNAVQRDKYATDPELNVLCFEMEAGGLMNNFPCLVIRGICDYSDSHKNDEWHKYAALAAAAYARELLHVLKPMRVTSSQPWAGKMEKSAVLAGIQASAERIIDHQRSDHEQAILDWLIPCNYSLEQSNHFKKQQTGTGQWLLDSDEFLEWEGTAGRTLFCPGIPGAGKTVLTSIVVNDLCTKYQSDTTVGIAYVYCDFRRKYEQTADNLLLSLLKQLSQGKSCLPSSVQDLYDRYKTRKTLPSWDDISKTLELVSESYTRAFLIVDALDECQSAGDCRGKFLSELFRIQRTCATNIFITSRFVAEITGEFSGSMSLEIRAKKDDVKIYLEGHISELPSVVRNNLQLQNDIITEVLEAVDGMFLLAKLYLHSLNKPTVKAIRATLKGFQKQIPGASEYEKLQVLNSAYDETMERINGQEPSWKDLAIKVLSWIICSKRPLTESELQCALAVEITETDLDPDCLHDIKDMVSVCAGLVTVDDESGIIRLVHYTTQEYFEQRKKELDWLTNAHDNITEICATYLSFNEFKSGPCQTDDSFELRLKCNQFYDYAANYWGLHARWASTLCQAAENFLECAANVEASIQALMAVKGWSLHSSYSQGVPRQVTGLHLAAYFGIEKAIEALLRKNFNVESKDSKGQTPLTWAVRNGQDNAVKLLLKMGKANANCTDIVGWTPLLWAADNGYDAIVGLLLGTGNASVNSKDGFSRTPLSLAAENGSNAVVKLLLNSGKAEVNAKDDYRRTPLLWAAENGHDVVAKLLLDIGANVADKDGNGQTSLLLAAVNGHDTVVKLLLDTCHPDVQCKDIYGRTPLSWAATNGHHRVVELLLNTGKVDVESKDFDGRTSLLWTSWEGYEEDYCPTPIPWFKSRTEYGSTGHHRTDHGLTPLSWAARNGHDKVVKLLLGKANIEAKDNRSQTPLSWAARNGHRAVVQLLIDTGKANIESKDGIGRTPLSYATENGHVYVVEQLLANSHVGVYAKDC